MKTTKKHFAYFEARCRHWIDALNLNDHEWSIEHGGAAKDCRASFMYRHSDRLVEIKLSSGWNSPVTDDELDKAAFHEILESYLIRLENLAEARDNKAELEAERHAIVYRVWNLLEGKE